MDLEYDSGPMNDGWLQAMNDFKVYQEGLLENLHESITSTYKRYEPHATKHQIEMLFADKSFRNVAISRMETTTNPAMRPEAPEYWPKYAQRLRNYDQLSLDLRQTKKFCASTSFGKIPNVATREYEIASNGDSILEFANAASETHPVLRFRVSSYMLTEASPFFAGIFSTSRSDASSPLELPEGYPPPPIKQVYRDGAEVKIYRMPQIELNNWESLTTLLHAAHMHNDHIPREVHFQEFVSIAEVCLRYQCTGPLEMAVEYRWLPQWMHKANEDSPDGFLLITYVFGLRRLFTRMSKSVILNISSEKVLESKELWPRAVREKIGAFREAKLAQIYATCASIMKEYIKPTPPVTYLDKDADYALTSTPKCPRGLHQCDAANLGWLMLVMNELGILPVVMDTINSQYPFARSSKSISTLVNSLWRMPSAPQVHTGVCDYAPSFRSAISDIYNSITGLTLKEITGIDGWALSKRHDLRARFSEDALREVFELPAPVERKESDTVTAANEAISLRILSHLDDLQDLHAAAMVNKSFYAAYKKHELALMKSLLKKNRRTLSSDGSRIRDTLRVAYYTPFTNEDSFSLRPSPTHTKARPRRLPLPHTADEDAYGTTPPASPRITHSEPPLTSAEVEEILWPSDDVNQDETKPYREILNGNIPKLDPESNAKFLSGDVVHVSKSLVIEGRKHLRDEQDRTLRVGLHSLTTPSP